MIEFIGFVIILAASAKIGFDISSGYTKRTRELKSLQTALEILKNEISFSNCVIGDALLTASNVRDKTVSAMFSELAKCMEDGKCNLTEAFDNYIRTHKGELALKSQDIEIVTKLFELCGSGDGETEIKNISNAVSLLEMNIKSSVEDEKKYVKLFRTSGILAGILIAIIFI